MLNTHIKYDPATPLQEQGTFVHKYSEQLLFFFFHNSPKLKTIHMSFNGEKKVAHSCAGKLLNNKKKQSIETHNMDEFQMHCVQWKKTDDRDED